MKSRTLSFNLLKDSMKRQIWIFAIFSLGFFGLFPMGIILQTQSWIQFEYKLSDMLFYMRNYVGFNNRAMIFVVALCAMLCALSNFSYLHSKKKVDFYHSLPVKRQILLWTQYETSFVFFAVPYAVSLGIACVIGGLRGLMTTGTLLEAFAAFGTNCIFFLMTYALSVIAMMLTGRILVGALGIVTLSGLGFACMLLCTGYGNVFLDTYADIGLSDSHPLVRIFQYTSPIIWHDRALAKADVGQYKMIIAAIMAAAVLIALSWIAYKKRPSEAAENTMAFHKVGIVIKAVITVLGGMLGGIFFRTMAVGAYDAWLVFGVAFGCILMHMVLEMIYEMDFRKILGHKIQWGAAVVLTFAIVSVFRFDLIGYDSYLPKQETIKNISVVLPGLHHEVNYVDNFNSVSFIEPDDYLLKNMKLGNGDEVYQIAQEMVEKHIQGTERENFYDIYPQDRYGYVNVCFELENGKKVYRNYHINLSVQGEYLARLYDLDAYKEIVYPVINQKIESIGAISLNNFGTTQFLYTETDARREELVKALCKDLRAMNSRMILTELPIGYLELDVSVTEGTPHVYTDLYEIYPSFKNTLAVIKKEGHDVKTTLDPKNVSSIRVWDYRTDEEKTEGETITSKEEIAEILQSSYIGNVRSAGFWVDFEENIDVEIEMTQDDGNHIVMNGYFVRGKVPKLLEK